jgi:hypothetical protein
MTPSMPNPFLPRGGYARFIGKSLTPQRKTEIISSAPEGCGEGAGAGIGFLNGIWSKEKGNGR